MKKTFCLIVSFVAACTAFVSCGGGGEADGGIGYVTEAKTDYMEAMYLTDYVSGVDETELTAFAEQGSDNGTYRRGIALSSYYTTEAEGKSVATYMIPAAETSPHSVAYLDVSEDKFENGGEIRVGITCAFDVEKAIILPEKREITPVIEGNEITFSVNGYNSYTLIVNDETNPDKAYTLYVRRPEFVEVPYGYTLIEYKAGLHFVDTIELKSNTVLYLHAGAILVAKAPADTEQSTGVDWAGSLTYKPFISASHAENIRILGHGVIDFSQLPWHARSALRLDNCTNVEVNGITMINAPTWTMTYMYCNNLTIEDCVIFGYRTNSDAYAVCSCENVTVKNCFARSGDDLFEVKSYGGGEAKNILFENCVAWPDNCRGFGIVQETYSNISGVTYRDCSLLYQLKNWSEKMASYVITAGEPGNVSDILFDGCDLFRSAVYAIRFSVGQNDESSYEDFANKISGVTFRNCEFKEGKIKTRNVTGESDGLSDIVFENVRFAGEKLTADNPPETDEEGLPASVVYR